MEQHFQYGVACAMEEVPASWAINLRGSIDDLTQTASQLGYDAPELRYVHFSDTSRFFVGGGNVDFRSHMHALREVGYTGVIAVECRPYPDAYTGAERCIRYMRAKTFEAIMQEMTIWIADDELIVGNQAKMAKGAPVYPEFSVDWIIKELDSFSTRTSSRFLLSEENKAVLRELLPKWQGRTTKDRALSIIPEAAKEAMASQAFLLSPLSSGLGHISVSYQKLIDHGIDFLLDEIREKLAHCQPTAAEDVERKVFYEACQIVLQAMLHFAERFAVLAETQAAQAEGQRKDELLEIARVCRKVPRERAETFHEALQSFWFLHLCLQIDSNGHSMSPGRFDQYTWRCYENDMQRGVSPEREEVLLGCLWVKFAEISKLRDYMGSLAFGGYPMFQNLIVGGMDADGSDVTNDVSVLCCKVTAELKLSQPSLSVRWHKHSARRMKLAAAEVARAGIGMPAYFNDEAIIPVLRNIGCSLAEARDYCEVGCVEPHVAGRMEGMYSAGFTNLCKVLETTIFNGVDPIRGKQIGLAVGLANLGDSMLVIKRKIFGEKKYSMDELRGFLRSDFLGHERVRQEFLNDVPKYGNDDEADAMARRCGEDYCIDFKRYTDYRGASFQPGLQSISAHALFVGSLGATPDGRTKQMLVSDGGVSPAQGRDICGPTAAMLSVAKLNHLEATNGALLIIGFFLEGIATVSMLLPLFIPIAQAVGIDLLHLGMIVTMTNVMDCMTPPVANNIFAASTFTGLPMGRISKGELPYLGCFFVVLLIVVFCQGLITMFG